MAVSCGATSEIVPQRIDGSFAVDSACCTVAATCGSALPVRAAASDAADDTKAETVAANTAARYARRRRIIVPFQFSAERLPYTKTTDPPLIRSISGLATDVRTAGHPQLRPRRPCRAAIF